MNRLPPTARARPAWIQGRPRPALQPAQLRPPSPPPPPPPRRPPAVPEDPEPALLPQPTSPPPNRPTTPLPPQEAAVEI
ncbi:MAG: hypothetical protein ACK559_32910, partial [bacterium]